MKSQVSGWNAGSFADVSLAVVVKLFREILFPGIGGRPWCVWNNGKDTVTLRKPSGTWVDGCRYNSTSRSYTWC